MTATNPLGCTKIVVTGPICLDFIASGFPALDENRDENIFGSNFKIAPGGKARNIAEMIATLTKENLVALVGRMCHDPYGLWKMAIDPLEAAGVITDTIRAVPFVPGKSEPAVMLIAVDGSGKGRCFAVNEQNEQLSCEDVNRAGHAFEMAGANAGLAIVTLGQPLETVIHTVKRAKESGLKVLFDPGGYNRKRDHTEICQQRFHLIKANRFEAEYLTGLLINDLNDVRKAAGKLLGHTAENVIITLGKDGAVLINESIDQHFAVPQQLCINPVDATGCGDQMLAAIAAALIDGADIEAATRVGVIAGALQAQKPGVIPITKEELASASLKMESV